MEGFVNLRINLSKYGEEVLKREMQKRKCSNFSNTIESILADLEYRDRDTKSKTNS